MRWKWLSLKRFNMQTVCIKVCAVSSTIPNDVQTQTNLWFYSGRRCISFAHLSRFRERGRTSTSRTPRSVNKSEHFCLVFRSRELSSLLIERPPAADAECCVFTRNFLRKINSIFNILSGLINFGESKQGWIVFYFEEMCHRQPDCRQGLSVRATKSNHRGGPHWWGPPVTSLFKYGSACPTASEGITMIEIFQGNNATHFNNSK